MLNWIYHGKKKKQCYHRPECLVCFVKLYFRLLILSGEE